jgi:hypothetical protein
MTDDDIVVVVRRRRSRALAALIGLEEIYFGKSSSIGRSHWLTPVLLL